MSCLTCATCTWCRCVRVLLDLHGLVVIPVFFFALLQMAFGTVKSRLLSETEEFVDLLQYCEFEEVRIDCSLCYVHVRI